MNPVIVGITLRQLVSRRRIILLLLLGLVMVAYGVRCLIDRYAFATLNNELFTGVNYTDANVRITAKLVVAIIAFIIAVVFFANAKLRRWAIPPSRFQVQAQCLLWFSGVQINPSPTP